MADPLKPAPTFRHRLLVWTWDLVNAALAGAAGVGGANLFGALFGANQLTLRQLGSAALSSAIVGVIMYVRQRRLPSIDNEEPS